MIRTDFSGHQEVPVRQALEAAGIHGKLAGLFGLAAGEREPVQNRGRAFFFRVLVLILLISP